MALTATMFLATAATLYVVGQDLPKTEHLNKMDLLLLGTLGVLFAVGAESTAVFVLHKTDLALAEALENATVLLLPVLHVLLNGALFAYPCYREWRRGAVPGYVREERVLIQWPDILKFDPWCSGEGAQVLTGTKQSPHEYITVADPNVVSNRGQTRTTKQVV